MQTYNEDFYAQMIADGHKKQIEFLEEFMRDYAPDCEADSAKERL